MLQALHLDGEPETMACMAQHDKMDTASTSPSREDEGSKKDREVRQPFPLKVYEMLEDAERQDFSHIVSWNEQGNGFMVHKKDLFTKDVVPRYFNQTKYKSFQRQLSLYGFQRITSGKNKGLRHHENLRRGEKHMCREMKPVGYKPRGLECREKKKHQSSEIQGGGLRVPLLEAMPVLVPETGTTVIDEQQQPINYLPAVVSTGSLDKQELERRGLTPPVVLLGPLPPVDPAAALMLSKKTMSNYISSNHLVISTDEIGCFEGMPFFLMKTISDPPEAAAAPGEPDGETKKIVDPRHSIPAVTASAGGTMDGQMKKAWEIGFAVAMTLHNKNNDVAKPLEAPPELAPSVSHQDAVESAPRPNIAA